MAVCSACLLTSCTNDDELLDPDSELAQALVGEWIMELDDVMPDESDEQVDPTKDYTLVLLYHFNEDGSCWKEVNLMNGNQIVAQPVDRYSTSTCKYTINQKGKVVVDYKDSEESDVLTFNGTKLTDEYVGKEYPLKRATAEQITQYKELSDYWHGGGDEPIYDVAYYKPKDVDNSQWMKQLADNRLVADLSLPGSHDACTAEGWNNELLAFIFDMTAKCQDLTINEQLKAGVRVFDLRPEHVSEGSAYVLRCSHGPATTNMLVKDFFKTLKQWLAAHPTEFCLLTVELSNTEDKTAWGKDFNALINSAEYKNMFSDFKARLTVGEMRGKVLILSKEQYATKPLGGYCYGWTSDMELEKQQQGHITAADGSETPLWVQDYWKNITRENKDQALIRMLEAAAARDMTADEPVWVINYPSAYIGGPFSDNYRENAVSTNKKTIEWLEQRRGSVGIIYMDFAGMEQSPNFTKTKLFETKGMKLIDTLIKQNFN